MEANLNKTGKELMSEMAHMMTFLNAMGFDTTKTSVDEIMYLKNKVLDSIKHTNIGEPTYPVKDAFAS